MLTQEKYSELAPNVSKHFDMSVVVSELTAIEKVKPAKPSVTKTRVIAVYNGLKDGKSFGEIALESGLLKSQVKEIAKEISLLKSEINRVEEVE